MAEENSARVMVVAAVIFRAGKVLLCQRPPHKEHGGEWEFPGGKVEAGETLPQAVTRELEEELDVPVTFVGIPIWRHDDEKKPITLVFLSTEVAGTPRAVEHTELRWELPQEAVNLPLAPVDRMFLETVLIPQTDTTLS